MFKNKMKYGKYFMQIHINMCRTCHKIILKKNKFMSIDTFN